MVSTTNPEDLENGSPIYPIAVVQFFIGGIIAALNVLLLVVTVANRKLRTAPYFLLGNLWFANLLLGVIVMVANVVDQAKPIALAKAEGTVAVMNCLATLATFLTISTARMVNIKTPHHRMALRSVTKILISIWAGIFVLVLIKNIVFTLDRMEHAVCYPCLLGFEAALLLIFSGATVLIYVMAMYMLCVHKKTTIHDASVGGAPQHNVDHTKEYGATITLGILLAVFLLPFAMLVVILGMYTVKFQVATAIAGTDGGLSFVATEVILMLFYLHCIANPIVMIIRDPEVAKTAKKIVCCRRPNEETPEDQEAAAAAAVDGRDAGPMAHNGVNRQTAPDAFVVSGNRNNSGFRPIGSATQQPTGPPPPYQTLDSRGGQRAPSAPDHSPRAIPDGEGNLGAAPTGSQSQAVEGAQNNRISTSGELPPLRSSSQQSPGEQEMLRSL